MTMMHVSLKGILSVVDMQALHSICRDDDNTKSVCYSPFLHDLFESYTIESVRQK